LWLAVGLKVFDVVAWSVWIAMALALAVGLAGMTFWPKASVYYGPDTAMCSSGCSDFR
jgi:hypothetical protein